MGAALLPLAIGSLVGTSLLQFGATRSAGSIARTEAEVAAKQEELGVVQREADRKGLLARALASQTASAGSRGIAAFEGSPLSVLQADIEKEETATQRDEFSTKISALTARTRGKVAQKQANAMSVINLIGNVGKIASVASFGGGGGGGAVEAGTGNIATG